MSEVLEKPSSLLTQAPVSSTSLRPEIARIYSTLLRLPQEKREPILAALRQEQLRYESRRKLWRYYPDSGPLRRELYPKHLAFFAAGASHMERAFVAANRSGKSTAAGYELALHLTGLYDEAALWWPGRRFDRPVTAWAAGVDIRAVRDSMQILLFGPPNELGTGMIPGDNIIDTSAGRGVADSIDSATIRHVSGGTSRLTLKTYEQGRESFQAASVDVGWCDEEPSDQGLYTEFLTRLMSTQPGQANGIMMATFTPLKGMSNVVRYFLGDDWKRPSAPIEPSDWREPDDGGVPRR